MLKIVTWEERLNTVILVIDNYDSFTYNLVQYLGEMGAELEVRRNDTLTLTDVARMAPEKILISPGPGTPDDAGITLDLIHEFGPKTPIFGVCLGQQAIGQAMGGQSHPGGKADARQNFSGHPYRPGGFSRPPLPA